MNQKQLEEMLTAACKKDLASCTDQEIYTGLLHLVKDLAGTHRSDEGKKKLYYISAEFLIGKLLSNNMINLGIYDGVKSILDSHGKSLRDRAGAIPWQRRTWPPGRLFPGFHCNPWIKRGWNRPELSSRPIQAAV